MFDRGFEAESLSEVQLAELQERARRARGAILTMTSVAESGHPGGSMSSIEIYLTLYNMAQLRPDEPQWSSRDRIVVEHGHTSPGVYSALADAGFFDIDQVTAHFRQAESPFEGHVERVVPGVEWDTGNLGQGLSAAVGMAFAARLTGGAWHTYCVMGDGGQHKGQAAEARRVAAHHGLTGLTVLIDRNHIQISGHTEEVMDVDVVADWKADGWRVVEVDGHDFHVLYSALREARSDDSSPVCIVCTTTIGKGVSFMEDDPGWHGAILGDEQYASAMQELGLEPGLEEARSRRGEALPSIGVEILPPTFDVEPGVPRTYTRQKDTDCRSAWGTALADIASANPELPMAVVDCDLLPSVKTGAFRDVLPEGFVQAGIGEHNAAAMSGAMSVSDVLTFWADFGVFGVDEVYNQLRLNEINKSSLKLALTHCGLDVGEDGKTHQCLDYVGAFRNFYDWRVVVPADPNQTDRAVRWAAGVPGDVAVAMGRSKLSVVLADDGEPLFGDRYSFEYGRIDVARSGGDGAVLAMGTVVPGVIEAADSLAADDIGLLVGVVSCPLELEGSVLRQAAQTGLIVTVEDHNVNSGLGSLVAQWLGSNGVEARLIRLGVGRYSSSGHASDLYRIAGIDAQGVETTVRMALGR